MCAVFFFFKQKTAYEMRISDWSSDVCSSDLELAVACPGERLDGVVHGSGAVVREVVHAWNSPYSAAWACWLARRQTFSGVAGMSIERMPSASVMALMTAGGAAIARASPQPFTPSGLCVQGVSVRPIRNAGGSPARGMQ